MVAELPDDSHLPFPEYRPRLVWFDPTGSRGFPVGVHEVIGIDGDEILVDLRGTPFRYMRRFRRVDNGWRATWGRVFPLHVASFHPERFEAACEIAYANEAMEVFRRCARIDPEEALPALGIDCLEQLATEVATRFPQVQQYVPDLMRRRQGGPGASNNRARDDSE